MVVERDSVDEMVRAWKATRPDLDASPLEVVGRVLLCARYLEQALVATLEPTGLSFGDFDVLNTLRRRADPDGTNPRELARSSLITSGAMTARIDRLEAAGLLSRRPDPRDRRGVLVGLTQDGEHVVDRALAAVLKTDEDFLRPLSREQREDAATILRDLLLGCEERSGHRRADG